MNRLAIFVGGYTEVKFVMRLVEEIAGQNSVLIEQNGIALHQRDWSSRRVADGDQFEILRVAAGG